MAAVCVAFVAMTRSPAFVAVETPWEIGLLS